MIFFSTRVTRCDKYVSDNHISKEIWFVNTYSSNKIRFFDKSFYQKNTI